MVVVVGNVFSCIITFKRKEMSMFIFDLVWLWFQFINEWDVRAFTVNQKRGIKREKNWKIE